VKFHDLAIGCKIMPTERKVVHFVRTRGVIYDFIAIYMKINEI